MSRVTELIDLIVQGKNAEASDVLNQELLGRSYESISHLRPHVAAEYFDAVVGELTDDQEGETEVFNQPEEEPTNETD